MSATLRKHTRKALGEGFYSLAELRRFLALSGSQQDAQRASWWLGSVLQPVDHDRGRPDYSFSDLISLFVVRELRRRGTPTRTISEAETYLRRKWRTDRPFVSGEIQTDGRRILVDENVIAGQIESADRHGQQVMLITVKDQLERVRYADSVASSWSPVEQVVIDPEIQFGEPVVVGTRLATSLVAELAWRESPKAAAERFAIDPSAVQAAWAFERQLQAASN